MAEQEIPWARISAEAAAIVVSILLAFAIDAAWQHRGEVAEEREILVGLEAGDHENAFAKAGELLEMIRARLMLLDN